jgi:hypothetical protein
MFDTNPRGNKESCLVVLTECLFVYSKIAHWFRHARSKKKVLLEQESSSSTDVNIPEACDLTVDANGFLIMNDARQ